MATNELAVGKSPTPEMNGASAIRFSHANWLSDPARVTEAQYRYRGPMVRGCINGDRFVTESPCIEIPTPGQSLVFYSAGTLAGGGIIES
jgi:tRNA U34 2-thiouridine synthase MnmA/TrmU